MGELHALFAFYVFPGFWPVVDERAEANLGRAAAFVYLATLVTIVGFFVGVMPFVKGAESGIRFTALAVSLVALFLVHVLSFAGSYTYFDRKGM